MGKIPHHDKQVIKKQASILTRIFFLFEQKLVKTLLQYATMWRSNAEYWSFCASSSWDCACEPLQFILLCLEEFSSLEEEEYAQLN